MATNKGGRPRKQIDKEQFEKLCGLQCTLDEMCCYFNCNTDTLEKWCKKTYKRGFSDIFRIKRGNGKISLRRRQFEVALSGNPTMLIWLGRNMLGQTDKIEISGNIAANIDPFAGLTTDELRKLAEDE